MIPNTRVYSSEELAPLSPKVKIVWLNAEKGYGIIAKQALEKHDVVICNESPIVATLNPGPVDRCSYCWKRLLEFDFRCDCGLHYCSIDCQFAHGPAHAFLCTAQVDTDKHPLIKFKLHAIKTNPMFLTSAWGIAQVLARPNEMSQRLANFQHLPWEQAVPAPLKEAAQGEEEEEEEGDEDFAKILFDLAFQAQTQLQEALCALDGAEPRAIQMACNTYFSPLLGVLERNQFEIEIPGPTKQAAADEEEEAEEACGAGIFSLCCVLNHSCEPNVMIRFESGTNQATVRTLRAISPGEELFISYVDENDSLQDRQEQLRDYGFVCTCARCEQEQRWTEQQHELAKLVISDRCDDTTAKFIPKLVGGFDISFPEDESLEACVACLCVLTYPDMRVVFELVEDCHMTQLYIPGFLAFREADICAAMLQRAPAEFKPDVLVLDGSGVMHPRQCGLASHVGVICNIPTIGVSKKLLAVDGLTREAVKKQTQRTLKQGKREFDLVGNSGRVWGKAFVPPKAKANPVFVSVGHRLDLPTTMEITRMCCQDTRVPAPVRHSDLRTRQVLRDRQT